jgi:hypothetical protein
VLYPEDLISIDFCRLNIIKMLPQYCVELLALLKVGKKLG